MMLRCFLFVCLITGISSFGAPLKLDLLKIGSHVYSNVTVIGANTTDLYFTHSQGISNAKLRQLDSQLQKRFGYDPKAAEEAEQQQELDDRKFHYEISSNVIAKATEISIAAKKAAITSELNIADPFSANSLIGKPAPELSAQKWLGEKPSLKGKCSLIYFWAPWSIPCRRYIPELNALHKKFGERVAVVGLTAEPQSDVESMPESKLEFPCGIDAQAKTFEATNIRSLPSVLLIDPAGIIRYAGHPAALTERSIAALISSEAE